MTENGNLRDLKRTLTETIVTYVSIAAILLFDNAVNIFKASGLQIFTHEKGLHPIAVGQWQIAMILLLLFVQTARKWDERRYC